MLRVLRSWLVAGGQGYGGIGGDCKECWHPCEECLMTIAAPAQEKNDRPSKAKAAERERLSIHSLVILS